MPRKDVTLLGYFSHIFLRISCKGILTFFPSRFSHIEKQIPTPSSLLVPSKEEKFGDDFFGV